jgi:hypothetical protein
MAAYPVLKLDQTVMSADQQPAQWSSAMAYKFVGVLRNLSEPNPHQAMAIFLGVGVGFFVELARKKKDEALPSDMSSTSLVGGGLIAGDALAALGLGVAGLLALL